jgi:SSS family solute:Na+ symporter
LLAGFVMGSVRFIFEVLDKSAHYQSGFLRWLVGMNFLHYSILMFVVCTMILIVVSLMTPAPERSKLAGLTFATVDDKIETIDVKKVNLAKETRTEHKINVALTYVLLATCLALWIYFR